MAYVQAGFDVENADAPTRASRRSTPASGASARSRWRTTTTPSTGDDQSREDRRRTADHLAVRRPAAGRPRVDAVTSCRLDAAAPRRPARRRARPRRGVVKDDTRNPTNAFKDRVVTVTLSEGARVRHEDRRVHVHRQPRERRSRQPTAHRAARLRVHPLRPRSGKVSHDLRVRAATSSRSTATTTT